MGTGAACTFAAVVSSGAGWLDRVSKLAFFLDGHLRVRTSGVAQCRASVRN